MKKECKLIMIPYEVDKLEEGMIAINEITKRLEEVNYPTKLTQALVNPIQPYLISLTDEIKKGDLYLNMDNELFECGKHASEYVVNSKGIGCSKVIATHKDIIEPIATLQYILDFGGICSIEVDENDNPVLNNGQIDLLI